MKALKESNAHEINRLMEQHKLDINSLERQHKLEIEKMELEHKHKLELRSKDAENAMGTPVRMLQSCGGEFCKRTCSPPMTAR